MKNLILFLLSPILTLAQIPAYYSTIDFTQTGDNLKTQLTTLITTTHTTNLPYTATGTTDTWDALYQTDLNPNNTNNVLLVYGWNDTDADLTNDYSRSKTLPPLFDNWEETEIEENISDIENIADGGAALTAYAKLQYVDMTNKEREEITQGLLKYCELDTLAMVMIYEHFKYDIIRVC